MVPDSCTVAARMRGHFQNSCSRLRAGRSVAPGKWRDHPLRRAPCACLRACVRAVAARPATPLPPGLAHTTCCAEKTRADQVTVVPGISAENPQRNKPGPAACTVALRVILDVSNPFIHHFIQLFGAEGGKKASFLRSQHRSVFTKTQSNEACWGRGFIQSK